MNNIMPSTVQQLLPVVPCGFSVLAVFVNDHAVIRIRAVVLPGSHGEVPRNPELLWVIRFYRILVRYNYVVFKKS